MIEIVPVINEMYGPERLRLGFPIVVQTKVSNLDIPVT